MIFYKLFNLKTNINNWPIESQYIVAESIFLFHYFKNILSQVPFAPFSDITKSVNELNFGGRSR